MQDKEHLSDPNDVASALEMSVVEDSLRNLKRYSLPDDFDGFCACGEEVHPERVRMGLSTCIDCATLAEKRGRLFAGGLHK